MSKAITFTLDLEDHRVNTSEPARYPVITEQLLNFLDTQNIKGTVFTVGKLAEQSPELIKHIHEQGHEIACHSYDHTPLTQQTPSEFRQHTRRAKSILEDIIGENVTGYRAPVFSLTKDTLWAVEILKELGFEYSSSILPSSNPLHGLPTSPKKVFRWSNGLLEIPAPVGSVFGKTMPYLGGFYFRYLPFSIVNSKIKTSEQDNLWTYCHPYDFDADEKDWRIKGASMPVSLLLWFNRKNTFSKLEKLAKAHKFSKPFKEQTFKKDIPVIDPATL